MIKIIPFESHFEHWPKKGPIAEMGPTNVVQVVTNAAPVCKAVGVMVQKEYRLVPTSKSDF